MLKGPLTLASFGLALNLFLWGIPGLVAGTGAAHALLPNAMPGQVEALSHVAGSGDNSLYTALIDLLGAESEALQVAGAGLQQPTPSDLAPRANAAGAHVQDAVAAYVQAARAALNH